jgi:hypothetical protein
MEAAAPEAGTVKATTAAEATATTEAARVSRGACHDEGDGGHR